MTSTLACKEAPLPKGELVLIVDTDLAVPELASELRVDVYGMDGRWLEARDVYLGNTADWPASFSLVNPDDTGPLEALVRLRAYPQGALRPYRGERNEVPAPWEPPTVAQSLKELCAAPPKLELGGTVTARRGRSAVIPYDGMRSSGDCPAPYGNSLGSIAARVEIEKPGHYSFAVVDISPTMPGEPPGLVQQAMLELRRACDDNQSGIACSFGVHLDSGLAYLPSIEADLEPGAYHLVTGGLLYGNGAADITLAAWSDDNAIFSAEVPSVAPADPGGPSLADGAGGTTPTDEPIPAQAIDRLVAVRIEPHTRSVGQVLLRGECVGRPSILAAEAGAVVPGDATTCIADGTKLEPPAGPEGLTPLIEPRVPSSITEQGHFASGEGCDEADSNDAVVCVPSGAFVEGAGAQYDESGVNGPDRIAAIHRFWMDRTELTVADYRLVAPSLDLIDDDLPVPNEKTIHKLSDIHTEEDACTWSAHPRGREDLPITCIDWYAASAFCQARGGDLPTSAQWEWAATRAGHDHNVLFPWGDEAPGCSCSGEEDGCRAGIFDRDPFDGNPSCIDTGFASAPAASIGGPFGDESPLGIVGLASNVREWARDAVGRLDGPCNQGGVWDPLCDEPFPTARMVRGGSFVTPIVGSRSTFFVQPAQNLHDVGVRCVYEARPF